MTDQVRYTVVAGNPRPGSRTLTAAGQVRR
jgi:hypothetical protein